MKWIAFLITVNVSFAYSQDQSLPEFTFEFSNQTMALYQAFMSHYKIYCHHPDITMLNVSCLASNPLFTRTEGVQLLYDYMEAATRELNAEKYLKDPRYHDVECLTTFTDFDNDEEQLLRMKKGVREMMESWWFDGFHTEMISKTYTEIVPITESIQKGLKIWGSGHLGVVAKRKIPAYTAIGAYHGDEYLKSEFERSFDWNTHWNQTGHPFHKKWDYIMAVSYSDWADERLNLPKETIVRIDGFHRYNHMDYVDENGLELNEEESMAKADTIYSFVNDPRESLYEPDLSKADLERLNVEFVYCRVDGVIVPFVVTQQDVEAGQQLFLYYGPNYGP